MFGKVSLLVVVSALAQAQEWLSREMNPGVMSKKRFLAQRGLTSGAILVQFGTIKFPKDYVMPRQSISLTEPNSEWLKLKVDIEGEYKSNSEAVNDLIRKAREIEGIRARLIQAEQSGFTRLTRDEIRAEIREEMRRSGEL
jgi:antitoxin ParD1/3/4